MHVYNQRGILFARLAFLFLACLSSVQICVFQSFDDLKKKTWLVSLQEWDSFFAAEAWIHGQHSVQNILQAAA